MPETERLLQLARARLREGRLPARTETTALGGRSHGAECAVCACPVEPGAPEIELVWTESEHRRSAMLHPACHGAWLTALRMHVEEPS